MKHLRFALAALAVGLWFSACPEQQPVVPRAEQAPPIEARAATTGNPTLDQAIELHRSNDWVEVSGVVVKLLPDDRKGTRHQRFLLRLDDGTTVLVAHNLELAARAPVRLGQVARLRGQYEWNEKGGVLHWTHHNPAGHDPKGRHQGGWIEAGGTRVR